jgi:hypothetical protein
VPFARVSAAVTVACTVACTVAQTAISAPLRPRSGEVAAKLDGKPVQVDAVPRGAPRPAASANACSENFYSRVHVPIGAVAEQFPHCPTELALTAGATVGEHLNDRSRHPCEPLGLRAAELFSAASPLPNRARVWPSDSHA